jgi:D-3-phosphoglycerate dehydrogenase
MNILIADKMSPKTVTDLESLGARVTVSPDLKAADLPNHVRDIEVLIVRSTEVTAAAIDAANALSLIIRAGAGVNTIDTECASARSVYVSNTPGKNTDAVAELAIGLMVAADRRIVPATRDLQNGKWRKKEYGNACGLKGRTLGILGYGAIGAAVAERAKGFGMDVVAWSRSLTPEKANRLGVGYCATPAALAKMSDVVSIHLAASKDTKKLVNEEFLQSLKVGAILVNTSRGDVLDTGAVKDAVAKRKLRVALDVFEKEPAGGEDVFSDLELAATVAAATPHIGASTDQATEAVADEVVRIVKVYKETGTPPNTVNIREKSPATVHLVVRHYNRVGVLASILDFLRGEGINIEEMNNLIFGGGKAASCTLKLDKLPKPETLDSIRNAENVIQVAVKQ